MGAGEMLANTWLAGRPHASSMLASACRAARARRVKQRAGPHSFSRAAAAPLGAA